MLEEHVHELPQHVVGRLDQLLADVRIGDRRLELPLGAGAPEGDRQAPAHAGDLDRAGRLAGVALAAGVHVALAVGVHPEERDRDVARSEQQLGLRLESLVAQRDRRQRPLADDHRVHELDSDVARIRARGRRAAERDQPPTAREPLRHRMAEPRQPLGLGAEEPAVRLASRPGSERRLRQVRPLAPPPRAATPARPGPLRRSGR